MMQLLNVVLYHDLPAEEKIFEANLAAQAAENDAIEVYIVIYMYRETERQRDRETDTQTDTQTHRHIAT